MGAVDAPPENTTKTRKLPANAWPKGFCPNPGGRPKAAHDIVALARQYTDKAIAALYEALDDPRTRVAAAQALLDRGYGRAIQRQELSGPDGAPIQVQQVPDDRPVLDGFLVEFTEQKAVEGSLAKDEGNEC